MPNHYKSPYYPTPYKSPAERDREIGPQLPTNELEVARDRTRNRIKEHLSELGIIVTDELVNQIVIDIVQRTIGTGNSVLPDTEIFDYVLLRLFPEKQAVSGAMQDYFAQAPDISLTPGGAAPIAGLNQAEALAVIQKGYGSVSEALLNALEDFDRQTTTIERLITIDPSIPTEKERIAVEVDVRVAEGAPDPRTKVGPVESRRVALYWAEVLAAHYEVSQTIADNQKTSSGYGEALERHELTSGDRIVAPFQEWEIQRREKSIIGGRAAEAIANDDFEAALDFVLSEARINAEEAALIGDDARQDAIDRAKQVAIETLRDTGVKFLAEARALAELRSLVPTLRQSQYQSMEFLEKEVIAWADGAGITIAQEEIATLKNQLFSFYKAQGFTGDLSTPADVLSSSYTAEEIDALKAQREAAAESQTAAKAFQASIDTKTKIEGFVENKAFFLGVGDLSAAGKANLVRFIQENSGLGQADLETELENMLRSDEFRRFNAEQQRFEGQTGDLEGAVRGMLTKAGFLGSDKTPEFRNNIEQTVLPELLTRVNERLAAGESFDIEDFVHSEVAKLPTTQINPTAFGEAQAGILQLSRAQALTDPDERGIATENALARGFPETGPFRYSKRFIPSTESPFADLINSMVIRGEATPEFFNFLVGQEPGLRERFSQLRPTISVEDEQRIAQEIDEMRRRAIKQSRTGLTGVSKVDASRASLGRSAGPFPDSTSSLYEPAEMAEMGETMGKMTFGSLDTLHQMLIESGARRRTIEAQKQPDPQRFLASELTGLETSFAKTPQFASQQLRIESEDKAEAKRQEIERSAEHQRNLRRRGRTRMRA